MVIWKCGLVSDNRRRHHKIKPLQRDAAQSNANPLYHTVYNIWEYYWVISYQSWCRCLAKREFVNSLQVSREPSTNFSGYAWRIKHELMTSQTKWPPLVRWSGFPDTLYNTAISTIVTHYSRYRKELKTLPRKCSVWHLLQGTCVMPRNVLQSVCLQSSVESTATTIVLFLLLLYLIIIRIEGGCPPIVLTDIKTNRNRSRSHAIIKQDIFNLNSVHEHHIINYNYWSFAFCGVLGFGYAYGYARAGCGCDGFWACAGCGQTMTAQSQA